MVKAIFSRKTSVRVNRQLFYRTTWWFYKEKNAEGFLERNKKNSVVAHCLAMLGSNIPVTIRCELWWLTPFISTKLTNLRNVLQLKLHFEIRVYLAGVVPVPVKIKGECTMLCGTSERWVTGLGALGRMPEELYCSRQEEKDITLYQQFQIITNSHQTVLLEITVSS